MSDPTEPRPATDPAAPPADNTVSRSDEPSEPYLAGPEEPKFAPSLYAGEVGTFGRYRVLKKLGQGGMGAVFLGYDASLERKIALKVMLPKFAASADARGRFLREARSAAKVKSDHVVTIYEVNEERGMPFIAMEYLLGTPLDQFLKTKGNLALPQCLRVVRETALGLSAAHDLDLIHRDIKPANLWLEAPKGRVKLLDFGLARPANDDAHLTDSGTVMGTPAYMSPEQGRGHKVDHRTDLFSLGVLLYRLTTGKMPFTGDSTMAVLTSLAVDTPIAPRQHNPQIPESLEAVIFKLLAKNPAERFQTAREVLDALAAVEHPRPSGPLPVVVATPVQPLAIGAQTQNVWEGIEDSGSQAVPLETDAESEAVSTPAPKPQWKKPERKPSKLPAILACGLLLVACLVLAIVLWPKKQEPEVAQPGPEKQPPGSEKQPPPKPAPEPDRKAAEYVLSIGGTVRVNGVGRDLKLVAELPKERFNLTTANLDRNKQVTDAGLVNLKICNNLTHLGLSGALVTDAGLANFKDCKTLTNLDLAQTRVTDEGLANFKDSKGLTGLNLGDTNVSDAGLAHLKDCKNLKELQLFGMPVGDVGLAHFKDYTNLTHLNLNRTQVSGTGLLHLKDCKNLIHLNLSVTQVGDAGLVHLEGLSNLVWLDLRGSKVTEARVKKLAEKLPQCKIIHDGGTIEPIDLDRAAAEWVLSLGGGVQVKDDPRTITKLADLPPAFRLVGANLKKSAVADADFARFKDVPELNNLELSETAVSDAGLARVAELKSLRGVLLTGCTKVTDDGMKHLRAMPLLNNLSLVGTNVGNAGLRNLGGHPLLYYVYLSGTKVTDDGLAHLPALPELLGTHLNSLPITDAGLAHLAGCRKLRVLELAQTGITDAGLVHLEKVAELRTLNLKLTKVTKVGVEKLAAALPACHITWDGGSIVPKK